MSVIGKIKKHLGRRKRHILDSYKLKQFPDDNFKFDENDRVFSKRVKNTVGKGEFTRYEQFILFPHCFQKTLMQTRKNLELFGKGLSSLLAIYPFPTLFSKDL